MNQSATDTSLTRNKIRQGEGIALAFLGALILAILSYWGAYRFYLDIETEKADATSVFSASTLRHIMWQHQPLLYAISIDDRIIEASQDRRVDQANPWLSDLAAEADLEAIYLINQAGDTVAASNYAERSSFVGENYAFRPYFKEAIQGRLGTFFAIGVTTGLPGYFLSLPVKAPSGQVVGVIVAKLSVSKFDPLWQGEFSEGFISNEDGVIILSSRPEWLYRSVTPLSEQQLKLIREKKQFADKTITPLNWWDSGGFAALDDQKLIHSVQSIDETHWQVHHFRSATNATQKASLVAVIVATLFLALLAWGLAVRSKRIRHELQESEQNRLDLTQVNERLQQEIRERKQAEKDLARAQTRLIQSSRMAALGQLSASVIHELGQPLSTFRNYLAAAEMSKAGEADPKLFVQLSKVAQRMQNTTDELRAFARPDAQEIETLDLQKVILAALKLTEDKLEQNSVSVKTHLPNHPLILDGRQQRLEQVVINLITNACQALLDVDEARLEIKVTEETDSWLLSVKDNGLGFGGQAPEQLFEAFYTTGSKGNSLGLGLAICTAIVSEHHGEIWAQENPTGGAQFFVRLPKTYNEND